MATIGQLTGMAAYELDTGGYDLGDKISRIESLIVSARHANETIVIKRWQHMSTAEQVIHSLIFHKIGSDGLILDGGLHETSHVQNSYNNHEESDTSVPHVHIGQAGSSGLPFS